MESRPNFPDHPGALRWGAILFSVAAALMIWPFWQPLVLATWFAILSRPLLTRFSRILRGRHRAAAVLTVLLLLLLLVPLGLLAVLLVSAGSDLVVSLVKSTGGKHALAAIVSGGGDDGHRFAVSDIVPLTKQYGERTFSLLARLAGATANGILGVFVFVLSAYAFLAEGAQMYVRSWK